MARKWSLVPFLFGGDVMDCQCHFDIPFLLCLLFLTTFAECSTTSSLSQVPVHISYLSSLAKSLSNTRTQSTAYYILSTFFFFLCPTWNCQGSTTPVLDARIHVSWIFPRHWDLMWSGPVTVNGILGKLALRFWKKFLRPTILRYKIATYSVSSQRKTWDLLSNEFAQLTSPNESEYYALRLLGQEQTCPKINSLHNFQPKHEIWVNSLHFLTTSQTPLAHSMSLSKTACPGLVCLEQSVLMQTLVTPIPPAISGKFPGNLFTGSVNLSLIWTERLESRYSTHLSSGRSSDPYCWRHPCCSHRTGPSCRAARIPRRIRKLSSRAWWTEHPAINLSLHRPSQLAMESSSTNNLALHLVAPTKPPVWMGLWIKHGIVKWGTTVFQMLMNLFSR